MFYTEMIKLSKDDASSELLELWSLAETDYDAFWVSLDDNDRGLTAALTCDDDYDSVFVLGGQVYEFSGDGTPSGFDCWLVGPQSDLELYVNEELTGIQNKSELEEFRSELAHSLPGIPVSIGQARNGGSTVLEWLKENRYVSNKWAKALDSIGMA